MTKHEFLEALREKLSQLPEEEIEKFLGFYAEMIDDRMEDGASEEDTISEMEDVSVIAERILLDTPLPMLVKTRMKFGNGLMGFNLALLILGFPVWFPLLIAGGAVLFSIYIVIWSLLISVCAVVVSLGATGIAGLAAGVFYITSNVIAGLGFLGAALFCTGLCILAFFPAKWAIKGLLSATWMILKKIKFLFIRKESVR